MSKILRISESDYRIKVKDAGTITLDVGNSPGKVVITGNLDVQGDTTYINVSDMQVEDNIILLNKGDSGPGVTTGDGTSGIEINRGSSNNVQLLWDEASLKFKFQDENATLQSITVSSIATDASTNLGLDMQDSGKHVEILNATNYESELIANYTSVDYVNYVTNVGFVTQYVAAVGGSAAVSHIQYPATAALGTELTGVATGTSNITFNVKSSGVVYQRARISNNGLDVDNINILSDTILNSGGNNLILTSNNAKIEINGYLHLDDKGSDPAITGSTSIVYSKATFAAADPVKYNSGLFVSNERAEDELVVKNRALLLSILF